jgi:hypothetical protein
MIEVIWHVFIISSSIFFLEDTRRDIEESTLLYGTIDPLDIVFIVLFLFNLVSSSMDLFHILSPS